MNNVQNWDSYIKMPSSQTISVNIPCCIKVKEFIDILSDFQLLDKDFFSRQKGTDFV
jgi:hypothetical protein